MRRLTQLALVTSMISTMMYGCRGRSDAGNQAGLLEQPSQTVLASPEARLQDPVPGTVPVTYVDARPLALMNGQQVAWGDLREAMTELAGVTILEEHVLETRLRDVIVDRGLDVTGDDLAAEQRHLLGQIHADPSQAADELNEWRATRGLGAQRFLALLWRTAALRKLVRGDDDVSYEQLEEAYELLYGERRVGRVIVVPTMDDGQLALRRIGAGESFETVAAGMSLDPSASDGGRLEPCSRPDDRIHQVIRDELWMLQPGELSSPMLMGANYVVVRLDEIVPGEQPEWNDVSPSLEAAARRHGERVRMDDLAERILSETSITIYDESLRDAWRHR